MKSYACLALLLVWLLCPSLALALAQSFGDDSGRRVEFDHPFTRIISLYGAHTENLFSLGLDREIIGVSIHEAYPPAALKKNTFSFRDDAERFLAARPDLVLVRPMVFRGYRALMDRLEEAGIVVVSLQPTTIAEMFEYWRRLGMLTGRIHQAEAMVSRFQRGARAVAARVAQVPQERRPRVYCEAIHRKMKTFAPTAMAVYALQTAGGVNVAADARSGDGSNIAPYGKERILSHARQIDVYLAQVGPMNRVSVPEIMQESGFSAIKAVEQGKVHLVDEKVVSRPTLRLLQGMRLIQGYLYPDLAPGKD